MLNNCEAKGLGFVLTLPVYRGREQHGNGREAGYKGTGSGRVRYGRREVLTPLSPPPPPPPHKLANDIFVLNVLRPRGKRRGHWALAFYLRKEDVI